MSTCCAQARVSLGAELAWLPALPWDPLLEMMAGCFICTFQKRSAYSLLIFLFVFPYCSCYLLANLSNVFELSEEILESQGSLLASQPPEVVNH